MSERASIELVIESRVKDLGGVSVRRTLPTAERRLVGPFIFFDHMGPVALPPGEGMDVRPHPHIGLATLTYLFDGEIVHRDSLDNEQTIRPGEVNWMIAGRGIAHSERTAPELRERGQRMHGLQTWLALPLLDEEMAPAFEHHELVSIPGVSREGVELRIIAGTAYGAQAPTGVRSPTLYVHARMQGGASLAVDEEHAERAVYIVDGAIDCDGERFGEGTLLVLRPRVAVTISAAGAPANVMLIGGAPLDGPRHVWWNFVSSNPARIEQAKADWREERFDKIPGDGAERIPLPEV